MHFAAMILCTFFHILTHSELLQIMISKKECLECGAKTRTHALARTWARFHQRSTWSFYAHRSQMRKKTVNSSISLGTVGTYVIKLTPGIDFTNILLKAFTHEDPKSAKILTTWMYFCTFGICACKSISKNVGEVEPCTHSHTFNCIGLCV